MSAPAQQPAPAPQAKSTTLYVGELDDDVDERAIFQHFTKSSFQVSSIRVCRDRDTQKSLGYCYVNFNSHDDASRALDALNYTPLEGKTKPVRMMWKISNPYLRKTNQGNLFINHLDQSIDHRSLYDIFSTFGPILSLKIAMDERGASKGYGFVQFESKESADKAKQELNGLLFNNKQVSIEDFVPRKDRAQSDPEKTFTNLYVKHLPKDLTQEEFIALFSKYGEIGSAALRMNAEKTESLGFGYCCFKAHEAADAALKDLHDKEVFAAGRVDKPLFCQRFVPKNERASQREKADSARPQTRNNLYIKNLDEKIKDEELRDAFKEFGEITSAKVMLTDQGVSKGFGFVSFSSPDAAEAALQKMFGSVLNGKPLYVAHAQTRDQRRQMLEQQFSKRTGAYPMAPYFAAPFPYGYPAYPAPSGFPRGAYPAGANNGPVMQQGPGPKSRAPAGGPAPAMIPGRMPPFGFPYPGGFPPMAQRGGQPRGGVPPYPSSPVPKRTN